MCIISSQLGEQSREQTERSDEPFLVRDVTPPDTFSPKRGEHSMSIASSLCPLISLLSEPRQRLALDQLGRQKSRDIYDTSKTYRQSPIRRQYTGPAKRMPPDRFRVAKAKTEYHRAGQEQNRLSQAFDEEKFGDMALLLDDFLVAEVFIPFEMPLCYRN